MTGSTCRDDKLALSQLDSASDQRTRFEHIQGSDDRVYALNRRFRGVFEKEVENAIEVGAQSL